MTSHTACKDASLLILPDLFRTLTNNLPSSPASRAKVLNSFHAVRVTVARACPRPRAMEKLPVVAYPTSAAGSGCCSPSFVVVSLGQCPRYRSFANSPFVARYTRHEPYQTDCPSSRLQPNLISPPPEARIPQPSTQASLYPPLG